MEGDNVNKLDDLNKKIINVLFLSGQEMGFKKIAEILSVTENDIISLIPEIKNNLESIGLNLLQSNSALSITTHANYSDILKSFTKYEIDDELSPAALQTLTIIGYLDQPSVADISFIRGINSTLAVRTLMTKGLIDKIEDKRYTISAEALKYLGLSKKEDLVSYEKINKDLKDKLAMSLNG
jgi:segregation and condensation protein B